MKQKEESAFLLMMASSAWPMTLLAGEAATGSMRWDRAAVPIWFTVLGVIMASIVCDRFLNVP